MSNFIITDFEKLKAEIVALIHEAEGGNSSSKESTDVQVHAVLNAHTTPVTASPQPVSAGATPETTAGSSAGESIGATGNAPESITSGGSSNSSSTDTVVVP